jgi:ribonuclease BN (tRNA processing enzyme)
MKIQLLPSSFDDHGNASPRQHLSCLIIDDSVAIDAGSLAMATTTVQKKQIRDVVLTHAHLDHVAGLPLFIDDLFATLNEPVCVHATKEVIATLERDIFNWEIYPRFSELENKNGAVLKYLPFEAGKQFSVNHLNIKSMPVNHKVPSVGFIVSDGKTSFGISGDTAEMDGFWETLNAEKNLPILLIECSFPNELDELAQTSHHLTPRRLQEELAKFNRNDCSVFVINIKPMYHEQVVKQIFELNIENLQILEVGRVYEF